MEQLFSAIPAILKSLAPNPEADKAIVFAAWKRCSGELLSARTTPVDFSDNRLFIAVADKTWQRNLQDLSPQMLAKLNDHLGQGMVKFIEFQIMHEPACK
jgi:predicted nucleic acid-binding Zn ribbon protein